MVWGTTNQDEMKDTSLATLIITWLGGTKTLEHNTQKFLDVIRRELIQEELKYNIRCTKENQRMSKQI